MRLIPDEVLGVTRFDVLRAADRSCEKNIWFLNGRGCLSSSYLSSTPRRILKKDF